MSRADLTCIVLVDDSVWRLDDVERVENNADSFAVRIEALGTLGQLVWNSDLNPWSV